MLQVVKVSKNLMYLSVDELYTILGQLVELVCVLRPRRSINFCTFPILIIYHFSTVAKKGHSKKGLLEFISKLDISNLPLLNFAFTLK